MRCRAAGQWFQSESGLHQNWMRDYDPTTGRYIQADPLGLVDGASVYNYALQNPGRYVDPRGENTVALAPLVCTGPQALLCGAIVTCAGIAGWLIYQATGSTPQECDGCFAFKQTPPPPCRNCKLINQVQGVDSPGPLTHCTYQCSDGSTPTIELPGWVTCPGSARF
ncbi:RHS repeat-associated core domain-containing protein [Aliiroseovarius halocynthiae]|uniref:RHS repeat-associated core domain-containing protein n=1 Tax=Aliiroseovarius halocynthiae TaxID=985055 RepID=A0A545SLC7_9RHOB|nr:RHS repeat-associated core domain-containing protein [Aliiroseovarius halocynthiae]